MNADEVVVAIGDGVAAALSTNSSFLGVDVDAFQNADIHPEYVTTVEVGKQLTGPDRVVTLEAHMKELRWQARTLAWMTSGGKKAGLPAIDAKLAPFKFGKKDSRRLDILVRPSDALQLPLLMVEAKLGIRNLAGVIEDIDRLVRLFDMYEAVGLLTGHAIYGAAVFHTMEEGNSTGVAGARAQALLQGVNAHLSRLQTTRLWLNAVAGFPRQGTVFQPVTGYTEHYDDGTCEDVFAKDCFHFAPGLVLLGTAKDIATTQL